MVTKSVRDLKLHIEQHLGRKRTQDGLWAIWNPYTHQFGSVIYMNESEAKDVARKSQHITLDVVKVRVEEM